MTCTTTLPSARTLVYTSPVLKSMVIETTFSEAVASPTDKRAFVTPKFWGLVRLRHPSMVSGGMGLPARMAARLRTCVSTSRPPAALETANGGLPEIPEGIQTMTHVTQGRTTPTPATSATPHQAAHQLFADAINAASMATWYTQRGNIPAAARKARQHLAALRALAKLEGVHHA